MPNFVTSDSGQDARSPSAGRGKLQDIHVHSLLAVRPRNPDPPAGISRLGMTAGIGIFSAAKAGSPLRKTEIGYQRG